MNEIKELQQKYQLKKLPSLDKHTSDVKCSPSAKGLRTLSIIRSSSLRQRIRANQREKSIISIAKWKIRDSNKLDEKVRRLKSLIDGLENVGILASSITQSAPPATLEEESPPPYSLASVRITLAERSHIVNIPRPTRTARLSDNSISDLLEHQVVMKRYLAALPVNTPTPTQAREKLMQLSEQQFKELRIDAFDELLRRQRFDTPATQWLPAITTYHPRRNEARKKLSTLFTDRFGHLIFDIVCELERRFPQLQERPSPLPLPTMRPVDTRRWGYVDGGPPPLLQDRPAYQTTRSPLSTPVHKMELESSTSATTIASLGFMNSHCEIFKTFRVSMQDTTSKVLSAAFKKYNINAVPEQFMLVLVDVNGDEELYLEPDGRPLLLYKKMERDGKRPLFMLKKITPSPPPGNSPTVDGSEPVSPELGNIDSVSNSSEPSGLDSMEMLRSM
jgi:hypothetical protein